LSYTENENQSSCDIYNNPARGRRKKEKMWHERKYEYLRVWPPGVKHILDLPSLHCLVLFIPFQDTCYEAQVPQMMMM
jgi:hypothetical protein